MKHCCCCKCEEKKESKFMDAYELLHDMPGLDKGTVFVHDTKDSFKGSPAFGCLKNAWIGHNCQWTKNHSWCGETHVVPGQLTRDEYWFKNISNEDGKYTCDERKK
jgi:hypothetical protein